MDEMKHSFITNQNVYGVYFSSMPSMKALVLKIHPCITVFLFEPQLSYMDAIVAVLYMLCS